MRFALCPAKKDGGRIRGEENEKVRGMCACLCVLKLREVTCSKRREKTNEKYSGHLFPWFHFMQQGRSLYNGGQIEVSENKRWGPFRPDVLLHLHIACI